MWSLFFVLKSVKSKLFFSNFLLYTVLLASIISETREHCSASIDYENAKRWTLECEQIHTNAKQRGMDLCLALHQLLCGCVMMCWANERILTKLVNKRWRVATTFRGVEEPSENAVQMNEKEMILQKYDWLIKCRWNLGVNKCIVVHIKRK